MTAQLIPQIEKVGFYDDWRPSRYGPFSPSLKEDTEVLEKYGLLTTEIVDLSSEAHMQCFILTPVGVRQAEALERAYSKLSDSIRKTITQRYANAPLMSLLHDVYYQFPDYSTQSEIAGEVFLP